MKSRESEMKPTFFDQTKAGGMKFQLKSLLLQTQKTSFNLKYQADKIEVRSGCNCDECNESLFCRQTGFLELTGYSHTS